METPGRARKSFLRERAPLRIRVAVLVVLLLLLPRAASQATPAVGRLTVEVVPSDFHLKAPASVPLRIWINGTITCDAGATEPRAAVSGQPAAAGSDGSHYRLSWSGGSWLARPDPTMPNAYRADRLVNAWLNATKQPEVDLNETFRWSAYGVYGMSVPVQCSPNGYRWDLVRAQKLEIFVEGLRRPNDPEPPGPDDPAFYARGAANATRASEGPARFEGTARVPVGAALAMAAAVAVVGLVTLRWFGRR
jgi:hypothetical protein